MNKRISKNKENSKCQQRGIWLTHWENTIIGYVSRTVQSTQRRDGTREKGELITEGNIWVSDSEWMRRCAISASSQHEAWSESKGRMQGEGSKEWKERDHGQGGGALLETAETQWNRWVFVKRLYLAFGRIMVTKCFCSTELGLRK